MQIIKTNMQLIAKCIYNQNTRKAELENYSKYYSQNEKEAV